VLVKNGLVIEVPDKWLEADRQYAASLVPA
jgi:hypothetical protein